MNRSHPPISLRPDMAAALFAMVFPAVATWVYFVGAAGLPTATQQVVAFCEKVIQFGFPVLWMLALRRDRLRWRRPTADGLGEGLVFGILVFTAMLAAYHLWLKPTGYFDGAAAAIVAKLQGFGIRGGAGYIALGAFYSVCHAFLEEYYWRWFVFGELRRLIPWPAAAAIGSLAFMAHHVIVLCTYFGWASPGAWLFSLAVAAGGAIWCWMYQRSGSLLGPWLSHLMIDAAIFVVGYDMVFSRG